MDKYMMHHPPHIEVESVGSIQNYATLEFLQVNQLIWIDHYDRVEYKRGKEKASVCLAASCNLYVNYSNDRIM